jgi:hypothetical protein
MSATARLKQLLFLVAALALVSLGLVAALSTASPARADEPTCVPTDDEVVTDWFETDPGAPWVATGANRVKTEGTDPTYTDWVNEGAPVRTETNVAPSAGGELVRYVPAGTVDDSTEGHWDNTVITFYTWTGGNSGDAPPVYADETETSLNPGWNATNGSPQGGPHAAAGLYSPYEVGNGPNTASWFLKAGTFVPGVADTDYLWQKQVRTPVPGTDDVIEYEYSKTIEGVDCPPVDNGKQIVVCKYTGTPPGGLSHIIVVSENTLNNVEDEEGNPFTGDFPFEWTDAQGQAGGSIAIGYDGTGLTLADCPDEEEPEICPEDTDHAGDEFPVAGDVESCDDEVDPGPDCEEDPTQEHCEEDDKDCEEDPTQEHCEEDDKDCEEDPSQDKCDEDNNPPVVVPDDGTTPNNSPSNGPTVRGASATAPGAAAGTTVAGTPAAQVPTAVNAGLAPQELTREGGTLGLLGIATALLGAALVGLTFRPKRRIGAALRART